MSSQEWERFGEEIRRNVQDAVDSRDFSRLNQTITDAINGAADGISRGMKDAVHWNSDASKRHSYGKKGAQTRGYRYQENYGQGTDHHWNPSGGWNSPGNEGHDTGTAGYREGTYHTSDGTQEQPGPDYHWNQAYYSRFGNRDGSEMAKEQAAGYTESVKTREAAGASRVKQLPALYSGALPAKIGGTALSAVGYSISSMSLIALAIVMIVGVAGGGIGQGLWIGGGILGLSAVVFGGLAGMGSRILGRAKRFRTYVGSLGSREYCNIKELSEHIGKSTKYVVKDVEKMIEKGWFKQGHLDTQKTCLMVSDDAYKQYTDLVMQTEQKKKEEQIEAAKRQAEERKKQAEDLESDLAPEVREVILAGEEYVQKIHACNDAIKGEEISAKISRMEMLVDRIFDRVEQNPESVSDLHRMMEYYLPTTVKLLDAYEDLDAQPVQGANIISSKQEIEKTLDTLNVAFEKLLDSLFQDTAWDVSSDVSVLHTMLAQEGLTEEDFKQK